MDRSKQIRELSQTIDTGDSPFSVAVSAVAPTEPEPALDLSVVIPVYNEAESLPRLHAELMAVLGDLGLRHEILAID